MQVEQDIPASALVRVYVLGPLEIWKKDPSGSWKLISKDKWKNSKPARSVFKRLLVQPGRRLARSTIEDDVWSESDNFELTTKNVYNAISLIRGIIGKPLVTCWDAAYEIAGQTLVWTDLDACAALLKEAENRGQGSIQAVPFLEQTVALLERGELLEGEYGKWCYAFRKRAEDMFRQARLWLAESYEAEGKLWQAGEQYRAMILTNPSDENALQHWITMLHRQGKTQEALKCYRDMKDFMEAQGFPFSKELEQIAAPLNKQPLLALTSPLRREGPSPLRYSALFQATVQDSYVNDEIQALFLTQMSQQNDKTDLNEKLQMPLQKMLVELDAMASQMSREHFQFSRRHILSALATLPVTLLASGLYPFDSYTTDLFLSQCAASLVACNHLIKSQDFWYVKHVLTHLIPFLVQMAQHISTQQATIAHLLTQCYLLLGILESHQMNWSAYRSLNEQAVNMSLLTSDTSLQVVAHVQLAMAFFQFEQPSYALSLYQSIEHLVPESSPLVQSDFFIKQALAHAQAGQAAEAYQCVDQAYTHFPQKAENDSSSFFTDFGAPSLLCWKATTEFKLAQQHQLKHFHTVWTTLSQADHLPPQSSVKVLTYIQILHAQTALALNDLEQFLFFLSKGISGAKQLRSARRFQEAVDCYQLARKQWPTETRVQMLAELFIEQTRQERKDRML